jgi:copper chaperone CopZ
MAELTLHIDGMHCGSCVRRVTTAVESVAGVKAVEVRVGAARIEAAPANTEAVLAALAAAGFGAHVTE